MTRPTAQDALQPTAPRPAGASLWTGYRHEMLTIAYIVVYLLALRHLLPLGGAWSVVVNLLYFPMGVLAIWSLGRIVVEQNADRRTRGGWLAVAISWGIIWTFGLAWTVWLLAHPDAGSPLWFDVLVTLSVIPAVIGFLAFPGDPNASLRDRRRLLDAALLAVGSIGLIWSFGLLPVLQRHAPDQNVQLAMALGEWGVVAAACLAYLRAGSPVTRRAISVAIGAHVLFVLSDYFWALWQTEYTPGHWVDAFWFSAWVARWSAARVALRGYRHEHADVGARSATRSGIAPVAFVAGAFVLLVYAVLRGDSTGALGIAIATSVMTALLIVRMRTEQSENRRVSQITAARTARFRSLISHAADFVMVLDPGLEVSYASPSAESAGIAAVGTHFSSAVHPDDWKDVSAWLWQDAGSPSLQASHRCRLRATDGAWRDVELRVQDRREDPHVNGYVVNGRDISDEVALEGRLRHAEKLAALHEMAGRVAHAFNNALATIQGKAELLADELEMTGTVREDVEAIRAAADRGAGITRQLLGFSGRNVIQAVPLNAAEVTRNLVPTLTRLLPPGIALDVDVPPDIGTLLFDKAQFEQVLVNLVANARDAMPAGGRLRISAQASCNGAADGHVTITVTDTGFGIPESDIDRIFEPFFTTKAPGRGTGLGLAMVHAIVSRAGGTVEVESSLGLGTAFTIRIPASGAPAARQPSATPSQPIAAAARGTVLLVDDETIVRQVSRRMLVRAGFNVLDAGGGAAAIEIIQQPGQRIDVVVTDMMMPGVSGRDVIAAIQQHRPGTPVVCVTGFAAQNDAEPLAREVQAIVAKPFTAARLTRAVADAIAAASVAP